MFKLGQKVSYQKIIRKIVTEYPEINDLDENDLAEVEKDKNINLTKERLGFIVGKRNIAHKAIYTFHDRYEDDNMTGRVVHDSTEKRKVYKVAYDMAHTNYVLEEDLMRVE